MTAMIGRGDNDTSVKSKVERDRTVATKDGGCDTESAAVGDPHGGEIPMELYAIAV